jgi:uncharacterized protein YjdB
MLHRVSLRALLLIGPLALFAGCTNPSGLDSITVSPTTQSIAVGETAQFSAIGKFGNSAKPSTQDVTASVTWSSSSPAVATVTSTGLATAVSAGSTTITATGNGFAGPVTSTAVLTVTGTSGVGGAGSTLVSLTIIPSAQTVAAPNQTAQFLAIGTTSSGSTEDLTNQVSWTSSSAHIATITPGGLATAVGQGTATITAIYNNATLGTAVTGIAGFTVTGGTTEQFTGITVTPSAETLSSGGTGQLIALGTSGTTGSLMNVTNSPAITWTSSIPAIATVSSSGLVTGQSAGTTAITAQLTNADNSVVDASVTVTVSSSPPPEQILTLTIIPATISVGDIGDTGQFLAIGTFSAVPYVRDVTNTQGTIWLSSFPDDFPVDTNSGGTPSASAGIVTALTDGSATIIAEASSTDGTIETATATFNCPLVLPPPPGSLSQAPGSCFTTPVGPLKVTLTVYGEGLNVVAPGVTTTGGNWLITAPSATGTPDVIHCGPGWVNDGNPTGGSVCVGIYPAGTTVTLTAPAQAGVAFGGWSYNCAPVGTVTAAGPNSCTITLQPGSADGSVSGDDSVSGIFNNTP